MKRILGEAAGKWDEHHLDDLGRTVFEDLCEKGWITVSPLPREHQDNICTRCGAEPTIENPTTRFPVMVNKWRSEEIAHKMFTLCWGCEYEDFSEGVEALSS